jgi:ligand-binding sensor domain-containing protein
MIDGNFTVSVMRLFTQKKCFIFPAAVVICCALSSALRAQTPLFRNLEALPKDTDKSITYFDQDSAGYVWLGTTSGVYRFDGVQSIPIAFPDSLADSPVSALHIGHSKIYCGLENGRLLVIDAKSKSIVSAYRLSPEKITSILVDDQNIIWAGTSGMGVYLIDQGMITNYSTSEGLVDNYVHDLLAVRNTIAVATDLGLSVCRKEEQKISVSNFTTAEGLTDNLITAMCLNGSENILLGMQNGSLCNLNLSSNRVDTFEQLNASNSIAVLKIMAIQDNILVLTESVNVFITSWSDRNTLQNFIIQNDGIQASGPIDGFVDQEGNLVLSFGNNKIHLTDFRLQFITNHDGVNFSNAHCVFGDRSGNIWFSNSSGIFKHAGDFTSSQFIQQFYAAPKGLNNIVSLCEDNDQNLWFGTFGDGLGFIDVSTGKTRFFTEKDGLINNNILSLARQDNSIWLATLGGASKVNISNGQPIFDPNHEASELRDEYIYCVYTDNNNDVWFGTDGKGLVQKTATGCRYLIQEFTTMGKSVTSIAQDKSGNIWFNSTDQGLQWFDGKQIHDFLLKNYSDNTEIFSIREDPFGNIVALINKGIAIIHHETRNTSLLRVGFEITTDYLNSTSLDAHGRMWLATSEAMIRYTDYNLGRKLKPSAQIESIEVMLVPTDSSIHEFEPHNHHVAFNITSVWLQEPDAVAYQYKLIGYDIDWVNTKDRKILFSQLNPGSYTFLVRSSVDGDWEHAPVASYYFVIRKPWWQTTWFIVAAIFSLAMIIAIAVKIRLNFIRRKETLAREKIQSQFDTLRNQVNPHFLFNSFNTLTSIIQSDQHAATTYVEKLSDYFRIVLEQREKDVITVKEELALVQSYLYLQKQRFGDNLHVQTELSASTLASLIPPMTIQLLTENAIKHNIISKSKPLHIRIFEEDQKIVIANNLQPKLTKEPSTGIGLDNIRNRYLLLFRKSIEQTTREKIFEIRLPIVRDLN